MEKRAASGVNWANLIARDYDTQIIAFADWVNTTITGPLYVRFAQLSTTTFRELAAERGLPIESVTVIREAMGGTAAEPDDLVREDELAVVPVFELAASKTS